MASDWHPDSGLRPGIFNITVDHTGTIDHVGVGYDVVLPSGAVAKQTGSNPTLDPAHLASLQVCVDAMWAGVLANEGLSITVPRNPPRPDSTPPPKPPK